MNSDHAEAASEPLRKPTHEELSVAAYQIYEEEGCPSGCAQSHWHEGERRLNQESVLNA